MRWFLIVTLVLAACSHYDPTGTRRERIVAVLDMDCDDDEVLATIARTDEDAEVRIRAGIALEVCGSPHVRKVIEWLWQSSDPELREYAARAAQRERVTPNPFRKEDW